MTASFTDMRFGELLEAIAARTPTPGGGAVASLAASLGAALGGMVVAFSIRKNSPEDARGRLADAAGRIERAVAMLGRLAEEDAAAYGQLDAAMKLDREDPQRALAMAEAALQAMHPPRAIVGCCSEVLRLLEAVIPDASRHMKSDLAAAAILLEASARSARWMVGVNAPLAGSKGDAIIHEVDGVLGEMASRLASIERACA